MGSPLISSAAEWDYTEALKWYAERSFAAAAHFEAEFGRALAAIEAHPERYPRCDDRHRCYLMDRFPYQIMYRQQGEIWAVIAVAHAKQRPGYWTDR